MSKFGPGTLSFGEVGTEIDVSCQVNSCTITPSKETGDSTTKLCGTVKPGAVTYTYVLGGNLDTDSETADGFFAFTQANAGVETPFTFTPNTADGTAAAGTVVIDPLEFGGEEYGEDMTSDFEFDMVGPPAYTYGDAVGGDEVMSTRMARTVVNGTPPTGVKPADDGTYPDPTASSGSSSAKTSSKTTTKTSSDTASKVPA